jgi:hypothetical protein
MPSYTQVVRNTNTRVELVVLPANSRIPTSFSITSSGTNAINATAITVTATTVALDAGTILQFGAQSVTLANSTLVGATSLPLVSPLTAAITASTVATTLAPRILTGADTGDLKFSAETVDTSGFGDGITKEMMKVAAGWTISLSGIYTNNAAVKDVLYPLGSNGAMSEREAHVNIVYGDGSRDSGVCQVIDYTETFALRDAKKFSCTLEGRAVLTRVFPT